MGRFRRAAAALTAVAVAATPMALPVVADDETSALTYRYSASAYFDGTGSDVLTALGVTSWPAAGAHISITTAEDVMDAEGILVTAAGEEVGSAVTDTMGTASTYVTSEVQVLADPVEPYPAGTASMSITDQITEAVDDELGPVLDYAQTITFTPQMFDAYIYGLEGTSYKVMVRDDITDYDGNVVVPGGQELGTYVLDGPSGTVSGLPAYIYGQEIIYAAEEVSAPYGYHADTETHAFSVTAPEVSFADVQRSVRTVTVQAAGRQLTGFSLETGYVWQELPLAGAVYGVYAAQDITGPDGSVVYPADSLIEELTTGADGMAVSSADIFYGDVYVLEESVPASVMPAENARADVSFDSTGMGAVTYPRHDAVTITVKVSVPEALNGAGFVMTAASDIVSADGSVIAPAGTQLAKGTLTADAPYTAAVPTSFYGDEPMYDIRETRVPYGYELSTGTYAVDGTADAEVVLEAVEKAPHKVSVVSKGSILTGFGENGFTFEEAPLEGARYGVYAASDIRAASGSVVYAKDELIEELVTDADGKAATEKDLHFGDVYVKELSLPYGLISGEGQQTAQFGADGEAILSFTGHGQTSITVTGKGSAEMSGMTVALYAGSDILTADGSVLLKAGEMIAEKALSGGQCVFTGLPTTAYGTAPMYRLKETSAPAGYYVDGKDYVVEGTEDAEVVLGIVPQELTINVVDADGNSVSGAVLAISSSRGAVMQTWTSGGSDTLKALPEGTYTISQVHPAPGYVITDPVSVVIDSQKQTVTIEENMNHVTVSLSDAEDGAPISGAVLYVKNENGRLVKTIKTGGKPAVLTGLEAGKYTVSQNQTTDGYQVARPVSFTVNEKDSTYAAALKNERTYGYIRILLLSSINRDPLPGGTYILYDEDMKAVEQLVTGADGRVTSKEFLIGTYADGKFNGPSTYYLQESRAPEGFSLDETRYEVKLVYLNETTPKVYQQLTLPNKKAVAEVARTTTVRTQVGTRTVTTGTTTRTTGTTTASGATAADNAKTGDLPNALPGVMLFGLALAAAGVKRRKGLTA